MPWWGVLQARVVQLRHRQGVAAGWRQPSRSPRQSPPAVTVMACSFPGSAALHRPLGPPQPVQLRRQRPGAVLQVLQVAVAVERPAVDAARPAAPVAGLRGARTGVVGLRPAGAVVALVQPRSGRDADLPGPARLPAGHQVSPPLAWLPGSDQPTKQAGQALPSGNRMARPPYSGAMAPAGQGLGAAADPKATAGASSTTVPRPDIRSASGRALRVRVDLGWLARSRVGYGASLDARAAPSARRCRVPSAPCRGVRSRVRARRPCPPGRVVSPAAPDAWRGVRWTNSRQSSETAQAAGRARRQAAAVGPG
jgi:hypothetical protein